MDRTRDLAKQLVNVQKRLDEQMDLDYARKGIVFVSDTDVAVRTGSWYGIKVDGKGTDAQFTTLTVDGQALAGLVLDAGDSFYGDITAVTSLAATTCNIILLKK
jgi:hypothetical protein